MKYNIKTILCAISLSGITVATSLAEGDANHDWAEQAAKNYEVKSSMAAQAGNDNDARIYSRMAQIKRDAGAAAKNGKEFSWDEYHKLESQLSHNTGGKNHDKNAKHDKKGKGNGLVDAATKYDMQAAEALKKGNKHDAGIYSRLAEIKRSAAKGELKNWDEYHSLVSQLSTAKKHDKHAKHDKHGKKDGGKVHDKGKPQNGFLKAAAEYQEKAIKAMAAGDEHNARIYTKLANMKKDAAAAAEKGKGYDWTEYFALQKELK